MVHRLVAILLICALFAENISRLLITAAFELNQNYIAEYFCVNKGRPQLHCDGKCYLAKKLKEAEENEKNSEREPLKVHYHPASLSDTLTLTFAPSVNDSYPSIEVPFILPSRPTTIFHPPRIQS